MKTRLFLPRINTQWAFLVLFVLIGTTASASDPVGVYAVVDKVIIEPDETAPERVQIHGRFAIATDRGDRYAPVQKGYLYFTLGKNAEAARKEWSDLKSVAGTNQIVAFGSRWAKPRPSVRKEDAKPENPDAYETGVGVQKIKPRDYPPLNELKAEAAPAKVSFMTPMLNADFNLVHASHAAGPLELVSCAESGPAANVNTR